MTNEEKFAKAFIEDWIEAILDVDRTELEDAADEWKFEGLDFDRVIVELVSAVDELNI